MTERDQFASPVMRARARLHSDEAGRQLFEESQKALPPNAPPQNGVPAGVDAVDLKDRLGEIETNGCDRHDLLPQLDVTTSPIGDDDAEAVHAIKWAVQRGRYMTLETMAPVSDDAIVSPPVVASRSSRPTPDAPVILTASYTTRWDTITGSNPLSRFSKA